jgi:hypothetical protein
LPVTDDERAIEIERLRAELSDAKARKAALVSEAVELTARLPEIRAAFGNPFFYSNPEHDDESVANYTRNSSHEVGLPTFLALNRVNRELRRIHEQLRELGIPLPPD